MDEELLSLREVADELGVHYMTAYRYVRLGILPATQRGRSWIVRRDDLEAYRSHSTEPTARGEADWTTRLVTRMLDGDDAGAWQVVETAMRSGMDVTEAYTDLIVPALMVVGEKWHGGEIDVADEHAASQVASRVVSRLAPRMAVRGVRKGTVVLGSTATELHVLPMSIAADLIRHAHFRVIDLGVNLPPRSFATAVSRADDLVAVAVSVTTPGQEISLANTLEALRGVTDAPVLFGGAGVDEETALKLGADGYARTAADAVAMLEELAAAR